MGLDTSLAMLKTFLLQFLTQRVGDLEIFRIVMNAYMASRTCDTIQKQEEKLWNALEAALETSHEDVDEMALVVDLDELEASKVHGKQVTERLQKLAQRIRGVRLVLLSSPVDPKHTHATTTTTVDMSLENMDDLQTIIRHGLARVQHFAERNDEAQDNIVEQVMSISEGSAVYAFLAVRYFKLQKSHAAFDQALGTITKSPHTVADVVQKLLSMLHLENDGRTLLSMLAAAERPLSRKEVEMLLQAQPQQGRLSESPIPVDGLIKSIAPFAMTGEGLITLRHRSIKDALVTSSALPKDIHKALLMRLFICTKHQLRSNDEHEPMMSFLEQEKVENRLASDRILEYTVRYWCVHLRNASSLHKPNGDLDLSQDISSLFPDSVGFVLLEAGAWPCQSFPHEAMEQFQVAYRIRNALFGDNHPTVLQSALVCAIFCENILSRPADAIEWYVKACNIGRVVLGLQSDLVISCCTTVLRLSESMVSTKRTGTVTYREQTLTLLISIYTQRYGQSSEEVMEMYNLLVKLYTSINETSKAKEITIIIEEIIAKSHHDHHHDQTRGTKQLKINIKKKDHQHVDKYDDFLFGYSEEDLEETLTMTRVEEMISMALKMVTDKQYARSEEMLLELWLRLDQHCRGYQAFEWHEKKIQVMLKYVEVLHAQKRNEEASALLLSCWNEYSNHTISTFESIIVQLNQVAVWMKRLDMSSVALTVFQKCWSWFKSSHKEQTSTFKQIEEQIAETSKEIVQSSSKTSSKSVHEATETNVMLEVFESSFSSTRTSETETTEVSATTIELCESLAAIYLKEERWAQAAAIIKQTLMRSHFSSFFSESYENIDLKRASASKHVNLVLKLAECYIHQKRYEKAENLYLRLYRLHRKNSARLDDVAVIKYIDIYVDLLKKQDLFNNLISFYQELLIEYRAFYGHTHARTINMLYALGDICRAHRVTHGYFVEYYAEIVTNLNQGALVCHEDAFRALVVVADHYYESQRFSESLVYFRSIIATFCKFGTKFKHFEDVAVVQKIMHQYYKAMEETKVDITEQLSILKEIRQACIRNFGEESSISVNMTLTLAEVCQRSEKHQYEAVSYYEHVLTHSKTVSKTVVERSQGILRSLYVKQATSSSSKELTKETLEKATELSYIRYMEMRKTHSVTSQATLAQLKELITLYHKQAKTEAALTEMRSIVIDCLTKVKSSQELIETAKYVANMYTSYGYVARAQTLVHQLKLQLIYKMPSKSCGFDVTTVDIHACFSFLAAFEWSIRSDMSRTIASFMAELLAESMFYERFSSSVKNKSEMHIVLMHAARLRNMLLRMNRTKDFEIVEMKTVDYFMSKEPTVAKACSKNSVRIFLAVLLADLSPRHEQLSQDAMTSRAGQGAVRELRNLLQRHEYKSAVELARCTYLFLMSHEGLDDPSEISLGFQLCLLMAGHAANNEDLTPGNGGNKQVIQHGRNLPGDQALRTEMMDLSKKILGEVLEICKNHNISLVRCQWTEINDLISLLGEVKDFDRLQWLLTTLWDSRDGQSSWGHDVMLELGTRLVQVSFMTCKSDSDKKSAIRMAEDLAYNVRRVHGARHQRTLDIMSLLASLYTSAAQQRVAATVAGGVSPADKNRASDAARLYFKKAAVVHEDVLKLLLDTDDADDGSDDESISGSSSHSRSRASSPTLYRKASASHALAMHQHHAHHHKSSITRDQEVQAVRTHLRLLRTTLQRLGDWARSRSEYERLTARVWRDYGAGLTVLGVREEEALAGKWRMEGFGNGKSDGPGKDGCFVEPMSWGVSYSSSVVSPTV